jgi:MFS family permease
MRDAVERTVEPGRTGIDGRQAGTTLAGLSLAMLAPSLAMSAANLALPTLVEVFDAPFAAVQWVLLAYLLAMTALVVGAGRLADIAGRRRLLLSGTVLFTISSLVAAAAPTLTVLVVARAAQGTAAAVMTTLAIAAVTDTVPKHWTGRAMGLLGTTSAVGTALGPTLAGILMSTFGWRSIFLATVPVSTAAFLLLRNGLRTDAPKPRDHRAPFDLPGTAVLVVTLMALSIAATRMRDGIDPVSLAALAVAAAGGILFARTEARAESPLVAPALIRDPALASALAANTLVATVMMATLVVGPFHLARGLGLDAATTGLVMSVGPLASALAGVPAGSLVDRWGPATVTIGGLALVALGSILVAALSPVFGVAGYAGPLAVVTIGYALFQAANNTGVMTAVDGGRKGVVSGLLNLSRTLGFVVGAAVMGALFAAASGSADVVSAAPPDVLSATRLTFAAAALLAASAIVVMAAGSRAEASRGVGS